MDWILKITEDTDFLEDVWLEAVVLLDHLLVE